MAGDARWQVVHRPPLPPWSLLFASGALTAVGLWLLTADPHSWTGPVLVGLFGLATAGLGAARAGLVGRAGAPESVVLGPEHCTHDGLGREESVVLALVVYLELVTTADGPTPHDLYLILVQEDGACCQIPAAAWPALELLDRVAHLDGVLWDALTLAQGSLVDYRFPLWRGQPGDALRLGQPISSTTLPRIRPVSP